MGWDLFTSAEAARQAASQTRAGSGSTGGAREWSVAEVNRAARELVEGMLPPVWVVGEVANFTRARSGHCYFSLRDADAQLRCVLWRDDANRLPALPEAGMQVRALGRLSVYEARGEFQMVVAQMDARGDGLWKLALERLRQRLEAEGLTAPERKRPLPTAPACVGIVTSTAGAALRDIVSVVRRRAPWTRIVVSGCRVQGDGAAVEIAAALELLGRAGCADVIIVGRGGGSVEDLWAFNEEQVARAICAAPVPVISAVGHETDVTMADLVADLRAPTPSAAAEAAVPDGHVLRRQRRRSWQRIGEAMRARLADDRLRAAEGSRRVRRAGERSLRDQRERAAAAARRLQALSPLAALGRGFALPLDEDGRLLRRRTDFTPERRFVLRLDDGSVACRVEPPQSQPD